MDNKQLHFSIITDMHEAEQIWNALSPHRVIDDEWHFRYIFMKSMGLTLHCIVGYDDDEPVGIFALQLNKGQGFSAFSDKPYYEIFGGDDTDDNIILVKPGYEYAVPQFLSQIIKPAYLAPLLHEYMSDQKQAAFYTNKYSLALAGYTNYEEYLDANWKNSSKKKIRQQIRKLYNEHTVEIIHNNYEDLEVLISFNKQRFADASSFTHAYRAEIFRDLIKDYQVEMITIIIDGKKAAVSYGILYKQVYIGMNAGADAEISNLGKLLSLLQIDRAIHLQCTNYDAGKGSGTWKEEFNFVATPQYKLILE